MGLYALSHPKWGIAMPWCRGGKPVYYHRPHEIFILRPVRLPDRSLRLKFERSYGYLKGSSDSGLFGR